MTSLLFTVSSSGMLSVHILLQTVVKYALLMLMVSCCNTGCEITSAEAGVRLVVTSSSFTSIVIPSPSPPSMKSSESYSKHRDRLILTNLFQRMLLKTTDKVEFIHQLIFTHSLNWMSPQNSDNVTSRLKKPLGVKCKYPPITIP